jgi:hypothetical protein
MESVDVDLCEIYYTAIYSQLPVNKPNGVKGKGIPATGREGP